MAGCLHHEYLTHVHRIFIKIMVYLYMYLFAAIANDLFQNNCLDDDNTI